MEADIELSIKIILITVFRKTQKGGEGGKRENKKKNTVNDS